jgi:hypothetical protein
MIKYIKNNNDYEPKIKRKIIKKIKRFNMKINDVNYEKELLDNLNKIFNK